MLYINNAYRSRRNRFKFISREITEEICFLQDVPIQHFNHDSEIGYSSIIISSQNQLPSEE